MSNEAPETPASEQDENTSVPTSKVRDPKKGCMLVLGRNHTLMTTMGHSIAFKKGVPTYVPPALYSQALAIGALAPEGEELIEAPQEKAAEPTDPGERAALVSATIEKLVAKNRREDFTAAGSPTVGAVSAALGFKVHSREIAAAWQGYFDKKANAEDE